jgi:hypothetical protein
VSHRFVVSQILQSKSLPVNYSAIVAISLMCSIMVRMKIQLRLTPSRVLLDQNFSLNFVQVRVCLDQLVPTAEITSSKKTHHLHFHMAIICSNLEYYLRHVMRGNPWTRPTHHFSDFTLKIVTMRKASWKLVEAVLFS